ncbi:ATP-dependent helicase/nuclease subunit B [Hoeflea marina]|uniref:ATP-dependent helicase/nuclease subunit B n=1 Tax=Hoeflea marina TaxID=274592 RepID=A0A317PJ66_9HYPH|nr:double-strand break repair protein AddB [Hoeflea marina]PWW00512.1 ATP-dependent helicase/nuclease subunit B [Hoeflea marina]
MTGGGASRVFTIPSGVPFLSTLADAILAGRLIPGLAHRPEDPLALAATTIYVPTRRAARALRSEIADWIGQGSAVLPVIRPLGETDDDSGFFDETDPVALDLNPPVATVQATLRLADLVLAWKQALPKAVTDHLQGSPLVAPANPADAIWLGRSLYDLIQAVESEEADFDRLDGMVDDSLQQWWQLTSEFLRIARQYWPATLAEQGQSSPARHHNVLLDAETRRIAAGGHAGPVIVAGSTGTRPSTARLIAAVSDLPQGAVVLPGLDQHMRADHWQLIERAARPLPAPGGWQVDQLAPITIRSHPQYGLLHLLSFLGLDAGAVGAIPELATPVPELRTRAALVSLALLPPSATAAWSETGVLPEETEIAPAFARVGLIEAANQREEAAALAAAMRRALEPAPDRAAPTVALVTPDRNLARRVVIELSRYGIEANDSGGLPLAKTETGSLARLVAHVAFAPGDPVALAALIKHPLARFGQSAAAARDLGSLVERLALRGGAGAADVDDLAGLLADRAGRRGDRHAPQWLARVTDAEFAAAEIHARRITQALAPLTSLLLHGVETPAGLSLRPDFPIAALASATAASLELIAVDEAGSLAGLWASESGEALSAILLETRDSRTALALNGHEWISALEALMSGHMVKPGAGGHSRAFIWGALEARLQQVDTLILASLNEGTWPAPGAEDPFLSRSMKAAIGLEPPERRVGQAAHDFQMAMGAPNVVLSRSERVGKSPTVPSRWLQRLLAVAGAASAAEMRGRGRAIVEHVRLRDRVTGTASARRPEPRPPAALQPASYSFSEVGRLRRDPYAIYGRRILRLDPLDAFVGDPGPRERGTLFHAILERFVRDASPAELTSGRLMRIADELIAREDLPDHVAAVWRHRIHQAAQALESWEAGRAPDIVRRLVECRGRIAISPEVSVSGIADRIDLRSDGTAVLIDYKTGTTPSRKVARILIDPQLALEAYAVMNGGFDGVAAMPVSELLYVRLTGKEKFVDRIDDAPGSRTRDEPLRPDELAGKAAQELTGLVAALRSGRRGFMSRVIAESARSYGGDFDHLARVAEWQTVVDSDQGDGDE